LSVAVVVSFFFFDDLEGGALSSSSSSSSSISFAPSPSPNSDMEGVSTSWGLMVSILVIPANRDIIKGSTDMVVGAAVVVVATTGEGAENVVRDRGWSRRSHIKSLLGDIFRA
jgi:hypothetical protein